MLILPFHLAACALDSGIDKDGAFDLPVTAGTLGTVFLVGPSPAATVRVTRDGETMDVAATAGDAGWTATLVLPAGSDYSLVGIAEDGTESPPVEVSTPEPPAVLGDVQARGDTDIDGFVMVTQVLSGAAAVAIVNRKGEYVWWDTVTSESGFTYSAAMRPDGSGVDWLWSERSTGRSLIRSVDLDGTLVTDLNVDLAHHDLIPLDTGGWVTLVEETRRLDGEDIVGSAVVEVSPDGSTREIWNAWDALEYDREDVQVSGDQLWWTHANGISYDPLTDYYAVSLYSRHSVVLIRRADGAQVGELGGPLEVSAEDFPDLDYFHGPYLSGNTLFLFNNGAMLDIGTGIARAVETQFDLASGTWRETWSFDADLGMNVANFGNVAPEPDGSRFVAWGTGGRVDRVLPDGTVQWGLDSKLGTPFAYCRPLQTLGNMTR